MVEEDQQMVEEDQQMVEEDQQMEEEEEVEHLHLQIHVIVELLQSAFVETIQQMLQLHVEIIKEMHVLQDVQPHQHLQHNLLQHQEHVIVKDKHLQNVDHI